MLLLCMAGGTISARAQSAPPNDDLANAQVVTGSNFIVTGTDTYATREPNELAATGFNTVWFLWTAPANLNVTLTLSATSNGVAVSAFQSGTSGSPSYNALTFITSNNSYSGGNTPSISFAAIANTTYAFAIGAQSASNPNGVLTLTVASSAGNSAWAGPAAPTAATPVNDNIANAQVLTGSNLIAIGYDASATTELQEPTVTGYNTLWYAWTAPANLNVTVSLAGSYNNVTLTAFQTGTAAAYNYNAINFITYNNSYNGGTTPTISFAATANTTYLFAIGAEATANPNGTLAMTLTSNPGGASWVGPAAPVSDSPANDDLANAQVLTGTSFQAIGYNGSATVEQGEPSLTGFNTVWYEWTAPADSSVTLTLAATYGSVNVAAYQSGTNGQPNYGQLNLIADKDTYQGGSTPSITFQASENTTYIFSVGAQASQSLTNPNGTTTLSMITQPLDVSGLIYGPLDPTEGTPVNDDFANARMIYGATLYAVGYNGSATNELGEPSTTGKDTLWYRWTAESTGTAVISTLYSTFSDEISVYSGSSIDQLSQVGTTVYGSAGAGTVLSTLSFSATANDTYDIAVGSQSADQTGSLIFGLIAPGANYFPFAGQFTGFPGSNYNDFISLSVTPSGAFTGKAIINNRNISLVGAFNSMGHFQKMVDGITFSFFLDPTGASDLLTGTVLADGIPLSISLQPPAGAAAPPPAKYTVLIKPDASAGPQGFGVGTLSVLPGGKVAFSATLADGTPVTANGVINSGSAWNLYVPLYKSKGLLSGIVNFQQIIGQSDFAGGILWTKPTTTKVTGFTASPLLLGSAFSPGIPALNLPSPGTASFFGGALSGTTSFGSLQQTGATMKATGLSLSFNKNTGIITGSFTPSGGGKPLKVKGVAFQDQDLAAGYFIDTAGYGAFTFGD